MNLGQVLVLILSFPTVSLLVAVLTVLEKWALRPPGTNPGGRASAAEPVQRLPSPPSAPAAPEAGGAHKQPSPKASRSGSVNTGSTAATAVNVDVGTFEVSSPGR